MSRRRPRGRDVVFDVHVSVGSHPPPAGPPARRGDGDEAHNGSHLRARHAAGAACARPARRALLRRASDERLIELARADDDRAFEAIIERYGPALLAHCRRIAGEAAPDAVQQSFISAWSALRSGVEVRGLHAWLFTIAHRAALELLREQGKLTDELPELPARDRSPEEQAELSARIRATLAAVAELPPRERDALVWTSIQGRSGRDTARALGVSEGALRQLVFRARVRARAAVSVFVPPALGVRLPSLAGHGPRRWLALGQRGLANASSIDASEALVKLAPVFAAGVLVAAPVAAIELVGQGGQRHSARPSGAVSARQLSPSGAPALLRGSTRGLAPGARASGGGERASAPGGAPTAGGPGGYTGSSARAGGPGSEQGSEAPGSLASAGPAGARSTVNSISSGPLEPVRTQARRHAAGVTEALAPATAAAQGASSSASAAAAEVQRRALERPEALPSGVAQVPGPGVLPSTTLTSPPVAITPP